MKLLITTSTYPRWDGDSTPDFVQTFAEYQSLNHEVYVLAPHYKGAKTYEKKNGVTVYRFRYFFPSSGETIAYGGGGVYKIKKTPLYALKLFCFVASQFFWTCYVVVRHNVTVINSHWVIPQGFLGVIAVKLLGKKVVITVHGSDVYELTGNLMIKIKRFTFRHSDVVCVNSTATENICKEIYDRKYQIVPMGITLPVVTKKTLTKTGETCRLLFVGRLVEVKGVMYLCEALDKLYRDGINFEATIIGDGPDMKKIKDFVDSHGLKQKVKLPGWIDHAELSRYFAKADIFVGPSLHEAQGLVFVEALASGVPVVASRVGGIIDAVEDGKNGLLVKPKSIDQLYEALKKLIDSPKLRESMAAYAPLSIGDRYKWSTISGQYNTIFDQVSER